jgi:hypothetical protein
LLKKFLIPEVTVMSILIKALARLKPKQLHIIMRDEDIGPIIAMSQLTRQEFCDLNLKVKSRD